MLATKKSKQDSVRINISRLNALFLSIAVLSIAIFLDAPSANAQDNDLIETAYPRLSILRRGTTTQELVARTWDGGGATNNWSEAANWSGDTVPTSGDNPVFDATSSKNATIDVSISTGPITIAAGYTGEITMAPGVNVSFSQLSSMAGGTFTAGSGTLTIGDNGFGINLTGGTLTAGSGPLFFGSTLFQTGGTFLGGTGNVSGCFQISNGTFTAPSGNLTTPCQDGNFKPTTFFHNNGTFVFTGGNANFGANPVLELNNLTLNKNENGVLNFNEGNRTIHVAGTLSLIEGRFSGAQFVAKGPVSIAPNYGTNNDSVGGSGVLVFSDVAGVRNIDWPSTAALPHIRIEDPEVIITLSGPGPAKSGSITMLTGAIQGGSTDMEIGYNSSIINGFDLSGGTFDLPEGDLRLVTGVFRLAGNGSFTMGTGNATLPCFLAINILGGTFNASSGTTTMCNGDPGTSFGTLTHSGGTFNGGSGTFDFNVDVNISGSAIFNATSGVSRFGYSFRHQGGQFNHNNGTAIFDSPLGGRALIALNGGDTFFNNLTIDIVANSTIGLSGGNFVAIGTLQLGNGTITGGSLHAKGNVIVESSADGGTSQLVFNGTGAQTFTNNGAANTSGTWTVNKTTGVLTAATDMILGTTQALNVTAGTLYLGDGSDLTAGAITIGTNGILASDSIATATITLGAAAINNGRLDLQGGGSTCPQPPPDPIRLRSSADGVRRNWSGSGVFNIADVDVKDMGGSTDTTPPITVFNGTNSGNNRVNWTFSDACGSANRLGFVTQPSNTTAGQTITPSVQVAVQDQFGNTVTTATNSITIAIFDNPGSGTLSGTLTRSAVNGVATFDNLSINKSANSYTLRATAIGLTAATSNAFNIDPGPAVKLGFITQPSNTIALQIMSPAVRVAIQDSLGNTVSNEVRGINLSGGTSFPNSTVQTVNGVATFSNVSSSAPGNDYVLTALSAGLTNAVSEPFDIIRPTLLVTNTSNSGPGSLRTAIVTAGQIFGHDNIHFNIPGAAPFTIAPHSPFPRLLDVTIDATTQPGFSGAPIVELNGTLVASNLDYNAGFIFESLSTVRGFVINRYSSGAVVLGGENSLLGNYFGTDVTGTSFLGGGLILLEPNAERNDIGGTQTADRNVLANGMHVSGFATRSGQNRIRGNYIGTNAAGTAGRNSGTGLLVVSSENEIGGTEPGAGNLISGNTNGLQVFGNDNKVQGNRIGTDVTGTAAFPNQNQNGILVGGSRNVIGGASAGAANVIAFNRNGVIIQNGIDNSIQRNSIHSNEAISIDLWTGNSGPTPNDPRDDDQGSNRLQNYPVLDAVSSFGGVTTVAGTTTGQREFPTALTLDFYSTPTCHASGFGDTRSYVGSTVISASTIPASFNVNLPSSPVGHFLVATATDANGNTSEPSACRVIAAATVSISGRALDNAGNPLGGTVVRLTGARTVTTTTTTSGNYTFINLPSNSNYTITAALSNYEFAPPSRTYSNVTSDQTNQNYTGTRTRFSVSGQVKNQIAYPLSQVALVLSGTVSRTTTAQSGVYRIDGLPPGKYSLTAVRDGFTWTPAVATFTISNSDQAINFTGIGGQLDGRMYLASYQQVATINADSGALGFVNNAYPSDFVAVSRDGRRIVFAKTTDPDLRVRGLYISNADGSNAVRVVTGSSTTNNYHPEFSPDGTKVAFMQISSGRRAIRILHPNGGVVSVPLPSSLLIPSHPTWISNTRIALVITHPTTGVPDIFAVNLDGTVWSRLTLAKDLDGSSVPAASPDGTKLVFHKGTSESAVGGLVVMSSTGGAQTQIRSDAVLAKPSWSPDGTKVAYRRKAAGDTTDKIVVVGSTVGSSTQIVHTNQPRSISWGPNYEFATPLGNNVTVDAGGAQVTLASVTSAGTMTFTTVMSSSIGTPPAQVRFTGANAYHITTSAAFTAPATTCLKVPTMAGGNTQSSFDNLVVLHLEGGVFVDRTTTRNFNTRTICADTTTLGSFVIATKLVPGSGAGGEAPSISGVAIDSDGNPIPNVVISLSGTEDQLTQTDAFGNFAFPNLTANGSYVVQPQLVGYTFVETSHTFTNLAGENTVAFVGTESVFSISGRITHPDGSAAVSVPVTVEGSTDLITFTDSNGDYAFTDLLPANGSFRITPYGTGFFGPRSTVIDALTSDASGVDFVHYANAPDFVPLSGRVMTSDGAAIPMARVTITGPDGEAIGALTNPFGFFIFPEIRPGDTYTVSVKSKDRAFSTSPYTIYVTTAMSNIDFVADP